MPALHLPCPSGMILYQKCPCFNFIFCTWAGEVKAVLHPKKQSLRPAIAGHLPLHKGGLVFRSLSFVASRRSVCSGLIIRRKIFFRLPPHAVNPIKSPIPVHFQLLSTEKPAGVGDSLPFPYTFGFFSPEIPRGWETLSHSRVHYNLKNYRILPFLALCGNFYL